MEIFIFFVVLFVWVSGFPMYSLVMNKAEWIQDIYLFSWIGISVAMVLLGCRIF